MNEHPFKWRGWSGYCYRAVGGHWIAMVQIHGVSFDGTGTTLQRAIGKVRRKLDNVRHAMWFTHREDGAPSRRRY